MGRLPPSERVAHWGWEGSYLGEGYHFPMSFSPSFPYSHFNSLSFPYALPSCPFVVSPLSLLPPFLPFHLKWPISFALQMACVWIWYGINFFNISHILHIWGLFECTCVNFFYANTGRIQASECSSILKQFWMMYMSPGGDVELFVYRDAERGKKNHK